MRFHLFSWIWLDILSLSVLLCLFLDFKSIELEINAFLGLRSNILILLIFLIEYPNKECSIPDAVKRINKLYPTRQPFLLRLGITEVI